MDWRGVDGVGGWLPSDFDRCLRGGLSWAVKQPDLEEEQANMDMEVRESG